MPNTSEQFTRQSLIFSISELYPKTKEIIYKLVYNWYEAKDKKVGFYLLVSQSHEQSYIWPINNSETLTLHIFGNVASLLF